MITGTDVIAYRKRRNLSRKALAAECGLTEGKIWRIENKGNISDDESRTLQLAGVTPTGDDDLESAPRIPIPTPQPQPVPQALVSANPNNWETQQLTSVELAIPPVNFPLLLKAAASEFGRLVSNSEVQTFKTCRRKWWLSWHRGLKPKHESPLGVRAVGDRCHRALQHLYTPDGGTDLLEALEREILLDRNLLPEDVDADTLKKFTQEADLERIMLEGYVQWLAETGADSELLVVESEIYMEAELHEFESLAIIGKIDVRVQRTTDGVRLFIDHKTVASISQPTLTLHLDEQMLHYHLLEMLNLKEDEPRADGALYNMIRRVKRTGTAKPPFYGRVEVRHNDHELSSFRRRLVGTITDIEETKTQLENGADHRTVAYPRPSRDCTWACAFFAVCGMFDDGSRVEDMVGNLFEVTNPLEYYWRETSGTE